VSESASVVCVGPPVPEDGSVVDSPFPALVEDGMGFENASRNTGVPKVSVKAIPRT
jgi:hypothetical protein